MRGSAAAGAPAARRSPLAEAAHAYAARKDSPNTRRAYASDWQLFERWCLRQGLDPLVPDPRIVGLFLAAAADGHGLTKVSVATLERRLAALTTRYRSAGVPLARDDRHITDVLAGIRRSHARPPRQRRRCSARTCSPWWRCSRPTCAGLRDKAILLLGFAGGLRRSEIVGLDCGPCQTTDGVSWIEILAQGALLTVRDKTGWRAVEVGRGSSERSCPVSALETWLRLGRIAHGPVFRSISGAKDEISAAWLSDRHVVRLVKRTALAAGLRGDLPEGERALAFAGRSLRAGLANSAEVEEALVQRQLGHASAQMTRRYQRRRERFRVNLTKASRL